VGKTRLAIQAATQAIEQFPDGVWFVDLSPLTDPSLVVPAIARTIGLQEAGAEPIESRLATFLRERQALVVIDNVEQVVSCAPDLARLLSDSPELTILATSREPLAVGGEQEYPVLPLATDTSADAVQLFVERAQAGVAGFALTDKNEATVAQICRRLDGLPLAIELAAARLKTLSPAELLHRLDQRLPLLAGTRRDAPQRQQTMRNAIAWSYDLLTPGEQALFRRVAVFVGGCTLDAIEAIAHDLELDVLDGITSLVDKQLLRQHEATTGETRYDLFETIREYGLEQLTRGVEDVGVRDAHAAFYVALVERGERAWGGPGTAVWFPRISAELDNVRAALGWLSERGDTTSGMRLAAAMIPFWQSHLQHREGRAVLERLLATDGDVPPAVLARAKASAGWCAMVGRDYATASRYADSALALARQGLDSEVLLITLGVSGAVAGDQGNFAESARYLEEMLALARAHGLQRYIIEATHNLGIMAFGQGNLTRARSLHEEAVAHEREIGRSPSLANAFGTLGMVVYQHGDRATAARLFREQLELGRQLGLDDFGDGFGLIAAALGLPELAARLYGANERVAEESGTNPFGTEAYRPMQERAIASIREALGDNAFAAAWAAGRELSVSDALAPILEAAFPEGADAVWDGLTPASDPPLIDAAAHGLTPRETEVLRLLAQDWSNQQIADHLFLSRRTVHKHVENILGKLGVDSRAGAAVWAVRHGIDQETPRSTH
jgi:non-specific serine/threonine protein kinase